MKKVMLIAIAAFLIIAATVVVAQESSDVMSAPYVTDFNKAKELAAAGNKPIVIDFYTDWCVWCKKFDKEVATQPEIIDFFTTEAVYAKINAEVDTNVSKAFKVMGFPTFVLVDSKGEEIDRIAGYLPTAEFLQTVDDYRNGIGTLGALLEEAQTNTDRTLHFEIADKYKYRGDSKNAQMWYEKIAASGDKNDSLSGESQLAIADMYRREDKDAEAMATYKKIVEDFKGTNFEPRGMLYVGHMHRWGKDFESALGVYNSVMTKYKGLEFEEAAEIYCAITYRDKGDTTMAISAFAAFTQHWPKSEDVEYANEQIAKLRGE